MMPINESLYSCLLEVNDLDLNVADVRNNAIKALDDILAVNPEDLAQATAFRKAIWSNQEFWKIINPNLFNVKIKKTGLLGFNNSEEELSNTNYDNDQFLAPNHNTNFLAIHQLAVEQRIKLSLKNASDEVLIHILKHNPDEVREYLAQKPESLPDLMDLNNIPGWSLDKKNVLTDEAIAIIKNMALDMLLSPLVSESENSELLNKILNANEIDNLKPLLVEIGIEAEIVEKLITERVITNGTLLSNVVSTLIEDRLNELLPIEEKNKLITKINQFDTSTLLDYKSILEDDDDFKDFLTDNNANILDEDINEIKGLLGRRYLEAFLPTISNASALVKALKANDVNELISNIKSLPGVGDQGYIELAVNEASLLSIKYSLIIGMISHASNVEALKYISNLENLNQFNSLLKQWGVTNPEAVIKNQEFSSLQQIARVRSLNVLVSQNSRFGHELHPHLVTAFEKLPKEKQLELIANPKQIAHVLNAKDSETIKHYLGKGSAGIDDIVVENNKLALFKGIHNAKVAKILAQLNPLTINIYKINEVFVKGTPKTYQAIDISTAANYKKFVDDIKTYCNPVNDEDFYTAFGMNEDGTNFEVAVNVHDEIKKLNEANEHLLNAYYGRTYKAHRNIVDLFLRVNLSTKIDQKVNDEIKTSLNTHENAQAFIDSIQSIQGNAPELVQLRAELTKELTPALYKEIKQDLNSAKLIQGNYKTVDAVVTSIEKHVNEMIKTRQLLNQTKNKLEKLENINPIHLINPAFQSKVAEDTRDMKTKYKQLAKDCSLIIDQLRREKASLMAYEGTLSVKNTVDSKCNERIAGMKTEVFIELSTVQSELEFYEKIQEKLEGKNGVLETIDNVSKKAYVFSNVDTMNVRIMSEVELAQSIPVPSAPNTNTIVTTNAPTPPQLFELIEKLPKGQVRVYDLTHNNLVGRFTEKEMDVPSRLVKDDKVSKIQAEEFEVKTFPKMPTTAPRGQAMPSNEDVKAAQVNFSLKLAAQVIASLDKAPTKDNPIVLQGVDKEELQHLWTALMVLGKNNPNMPFDYSAIKVRSTAFDPNKELGTLWGFSNESLYETVYKNHSLVKEIKEGLETVTEEKFGHESEIKAVNKSVDQVTDLFKNKLKDAKTKIEETMDKEGPVLKR